jgi:catechol 2,3-dioxygenase-like lactoylglutathione lyase family enzyme
MSTTTLRFEVTTLPVADVDRAKAFYEGLGWRLDADLVPGEGKRVVQFTPPGSDASIHFGQGLTTAAPGSAQRSFLIVEDIESAREELISRGAGVSEIWHNNPEQGQAPGSDPDGRSYNSYASFADPDGNTWILQEIVERLPGRVTVEPAALAELLHETSLRHGEFEAVAPPHNWWDWYAAYIEGRRGGLPSDQASEAAGRYMAEAKHVVVAAG